MLQVLRGEEAERSPDSIGAVPFEPVLDPPSVPKTPKAAFLTLPAPWRAVKEPHCAGKWEGCHAARVACGRATRLIRVGTPFWRPPGSTKCSRVEFYLLAILVIATISG